MSHVNQAPSAVVMVRPHHFTSNPQTMLDNAFQSECLAPNQSEQAYSEVTNAVKLLKNEGVKVHLFEDEQTHTPDSVFPNNWFSTHQSGELIIYPMFVENRRLEYRKDIIDFLTDHYKVTVVTDYAHLAKENSFLEGTGSLVIDHQNKLAYAVESKRTTKSVVNTICEQLKLSPIVFNAYDEQGTAVYHTNVLMCIATKFVMISLNMVPIEQHAQLAKHFLKSHHQVIDLTLEQINNFCGNAIELQGKNGRILALSQTAFNALTPAQITVIQKTAKLVPLPIPTIESAGGSVRCMIAGVHLQNK
ncbi:MULTISPECIES: citrulline utilization hydrolase CtlX [unclassified Pseudoalteromonas]|uniref:citrulline utilization hydrolase CtlX n=1 Tax=unclassified Pseudoalteromonas TaxID=194690 RepID=UPI0003FBE926|nr:MULTISPECIES: arginine deiminase-related protein [unclassified Pseudoalteromonas]MBB1445098.1 amidinotransferase [Pseudoalteromonas sp. SG43-3]